MVDFWSGKTVQFERIVSAEEEDIFFSFLDLLHNDNPLTLLFGLVQVR